MGRAHALQPLAEEPLPTSRRTLCESGLEGRVHSANLEN